jgi:hypothetical protein
MKRLASCRDRYDFFPALIFAHLFFCAAPILFSLPDCGTSGYWSGFPSPLPSDIFSLSPAASVSKGLVSAPQSMQIQTFWVVSGRWLLCAQSMLRIVLSGHAHVAILFRTAPL